MSAAVDIDELKTRAQTLIELERWHEAAGLLSVGLRQEPNDYELLCLMAQIAALQERWKDARLFAERAVSAEPGQAWAYRLLGSILRGCLRRHDAVKAAQEAVRLDPADPANWQMLIDTQLHVFDLPAARASAESLRNLAPYLPDTYNALALVALAEENYTEAEAHCRKELELDPNSYAGMNNLGVAQLEQKRSRDAIDSFHHAARIDPEADLARSNLQFAVAKYLPQFGGGIFGLWAIVQVVRLFDREWARGILVVAVGAILVLVGGFFALRWYRWRRIPRAVRMYVQFSTIAQRREKRRLAFLVLAVFCVCSAALWLLAMWALWEDFTKNWSFWLMFVPPAVICIVGAANWLASLANRRDE